MVWAVSLSTTELIPRRLTPDALAALRGLVGFGKDKPPEPIQRPTRGDSPVGAAPQCLSGRTSYLRVRLAFHPYPQLVQPICNSGRCGPPRPVTGASPWPWVAHAVSGPVPDALPSRRRTGRPSQTRLRCSTGPSGPRTATSTD